MSPITRTHKPKTRVPEPIARPTRTTVQGAIALGLVTLWSEHVDRLTRDELGMYVLVVTAVVNSLIVFIEDKTGFALLRNIPQPTAPVVDDEKPRRKREPRNNRIS